MALTRKFLNSLKLEEAVIESIIEAHGETVDALKKQRDDALADASKAKEAIRERDQLKQQVEALQKQGGDAAKVQADFDAYKQQVEADKLTARKGDALDAVMKDAGITRDRYRADLRRSYDLATLELDENGQPKEREQLVERIRQEYADYVSTESTKGAPPATPPAGNGGFRSKEEILKIKDHAERQRAIAENHEAFGF